MKRMLTMLAVALLVVALASGAALATVGNIKNTKHDLSITSTAATKSSNEDEICVFCHTPHNAAKAVPLWNRTNSAANYTTYSSTTLDGQRDTISGSSTNISVLCLSCHDGTISLGSVVNNYPSGSMVRGEDPAFTAGPTVDATGKLIAANTKLGTDLSTTHPIAIEYKETADMNTISSLTNVVLFGNTPKKVECASCHSVHNNDNPPFLRRSNTGSALCLECHKK
ncbi:MAG: cytochrome c3 family protein [Betaproteobacteria bacterium]